MNDNFFKQTALKRHTDKVYKRGFSVYDIAKSTVDSCMTNVGIDCGAFCISTGIENNRYQFQYIFSRGISKLRKAGSVIHINIPYPLMRDRSIKDIIEFNKQITGGILDDIRNIAYVDDFEGKPIALVLLGSRLNGLECKKEDLDLIESLLQPTSLALQLVLKMEEVEGKNKQLEKRLFEISYLKDAAQTISQKIEYLDLSETCFHESLGIMNASGGILAIPQNSKNEFKVIKHRPPFLEKDKYLESLLLGDNLIQLFLKSDNLIYGPDYFHRSEFISFFEKNPSIDIEKIQALIPIVVDNKILNLYVIGHYKDSFNYELLQAFIFQAHSAFKNAILIGDLNRTKEKESNLRIFFQKYVHEKIVEDAINSTDSIKDGFKKDVVILFSDIRGFTNLCETLRDPEKIVRILNEYFELTLNSIQSHGGQLDKLIGDAIMATWGIFDAPYHLEMNNPAIQKIKKLDQLQKAAYACLAMINDLKMYNQHKNIKLDIGIGLHYGEVSVGNIGSSKKMNFTIIGDSVNVSSRLESLTKYYKVKIIVSESVHSEISDFFVFRELDTIKVKGKNEPIKIYELIDYINEVSSP
ncbi:MAG TPA: adenylate/guanylate cyclase domain-containing protein [Leptospiraceae bacterium]|nr:adenylate/guanylate cyclase domain-containing protein [Leptospiraceae bacterium]